MVSGWQDSNLRPPAPKAGILPTVLHPGIDFLPVQYDLLFNTTLMVKEGLGYPIGFENFVHTGKGSGLVFIPLSPELSSPMHVIWKKYQAFTPASKILLEELEKELR